MRSSRFVDIRTLFENHRFRTVEQLSRVYQDHDRLVELVRSEISFYVGEGLVKNKRVFLKPNWVKHNREDYHEICLRTNDNFVLATLEAILGWNPASVLIADAPVQGCRWDRVFSRSLRERIETLGRKYGTPIEVKDLRRTVFSPRENTIKVEQRPIEDYLIFDLGENSYLEPIIGEGENRFRVTDYDPETLARNHGKGVHRYCITRELFENDLVINLPKVKTHQKTGITNALKIIVGLNGDKDFLPHHRRGSREEGGDCYPNRNVLRGLAEDLLDMANRNKGSWKYKPLKRLAAALWKLSLPAADTNMAAAWYGNDTTWRMVMDLNLIAKYGTSEGTISTVPQREIFYLCDGIIGGQGDGPLNPEPLPLGIVCFSNDAVAADLFVSNLMGFDTEKIPMLRAATESIAHDNQRTLFVVDGRPVSEDELASIIEELCVSADPPPGWKGHLEML